MVFRAFLKYFVIVLTLSMALVFLEKSPSHAIDSDALLPSPGKSLVHIMRQDDGLFTNYVYVDGIKISKQKAGEIVSIEVEAGFHELKVKAINTQFTSIEKLEVELKSGEIKYLECFTKQHVMFSPVHPYGENMHVNLRDLDVSDVPQVVSKCKTGNLFSMRGRSADLKSRGYELTTTYQDTISSTYNRIASLAKRDSTSKRNRINKHGVAVIIGNRYYSKNSPDVPDVDFAHNDAYAIYQYVTKVLGYDEGNIIYLKDATQAQLLSAFGNARSHKGKLFNWMRPEQSDVFVYYSGHGVPGLEDGKGYLLPVNADPETVEINGYPLETLYTNLAKLPAKNVTVVLDACFSGSSAGGAVFRNASSITLRVTDTKPLIKNGVILTASGANEVASWDKESKMGLFTRNFLEGVNGLADGDEFGNGDGVVTLQELKTYMSSEVTYQARRNYGRMQNPQFYGNLNRVISAKK